MTQAEAVITGLGARLERWLLEIYGMNGHDTWSPCFFELGVGTYPPAASTKKAPVLRRMRDLKSRHPDAKYRIVSTRETDAELEDRAP